MYIEFNGVVYPNNSAIPLSQVGGGANGVYCRTNNKPCCGDPGARQGEFYYPNGTIVAIEEDGGDFYRDRLPVYTSEPKDSGQQQCLRCRKVSM